MIGLFSLIMSVFSCQKVDKILPGEVNIGSSEVLIPTSAKLVNEKKSRVSYKEGFDDYENFAKELAKMLGDKKMREFLKSEAVKQFDGDFDILVSSHKEKFKKFENLMSETPKLNIGFNELVERWDIDKNSILVASRIGLNADAKTLIAYDFKGRKYEIDSKIEPDKPIIVIGYNERVDILGGKLKILNFKSNKNDIISKSRIASCSYPYRSGSANYERLKGMKFSDLSHYEPWYDFKPEISFRVYAPTQSNNFASVGKIIDQPFSPNRYSVNNSWWDFDTPLFIWETPKYTTTLIYEFLEIDDSGQTSTITVGLSQTFGIGSNNAAGTPNINASVTPTTGFSYTKKGYDMTIGRHPVEMLYCPPNSDGSYQFGAGSTTFYYKSGY